MINIKEKFFLVERVSFFFVEIEGEKVNDGKLRRKKEKDFCWKMAAFYLQL